jgi:hypothetical protein
VPPGRVAAIGEDRRVRGWGLAGVLVLPAEDADAVRAAWRRLPADVTLAVLTPRAAAALGPAPASGSRLVVELPP